MFALKRLVRIAVSLVLGWFLLVVPMWIAGLFGMHGWRFFHSGWVLLSLPLTTSAAFWFLGFIPMFNLRAKVVKQNNA